MDVIAKAHKKQMSGSERDRAKNIRCRNVCKSFAVFFSNCKCMACAHFSFQQTPAAAVRLTNNTQTKNKVNLYFLPFVGFCLSIQYHILYTCSRRREKTAAHRRLNISYKVNAIGRMSSLISIKTGVWENERENCRLSEVVLVKSHFIQSDFQVNNNSSNAQTPTHANTSPMFEFSIIP